MEKISSGMIGIQILQDINQIHLKRAAFYEQIV